MSTYIKKNILIYWKCPRSLHEDGRYNWTLTSPEDPPYKYPNFLKWGLNQPNAPQGYDHYEQCSALNIIPGEEDLVHDVSCYEQNYCIVCRSIFSCLSISSS